MSLPVTPTLPTPTRGRHYMQTRTATSPSLDLVLLLSDAALQSAAAAREAFLNRDVRARRAMLSRLLAIIAELQNTLDIENGGKIAKDLDRLYTWVTSRLIDATGQQSVRPIDDAIRILQPLRDAWQSVAAATGSHPAKA